MTAFKTREIWLMRLGRMDNMLKLMNDNLYSSLRTLLEFVERNNKGDKEIDVAHAAEIVETYLNSFDE
jgi:hypothetical protein